MWQPTERTNIAFSGGQRFFGDTYNGLASHRTRLTVWDASYDESMTTFNQQAQQGLRLALEVPAFEEASTSLSQRKIQASIPDSSSKPVARSLAWVCPGSFFDPTNFLTNRLFLQKRFQASFALNGLRNTFV